MSVTCHCEATDLHFGPARAEEELATYRRRGPTGTARRLLGMVRRAGIHADTLLDIGGGVGVLVHELLTDNGAGAAVYVEAARAYVDAARQESTRRGHRERVRFLHGDFNALASAVGPADLVTLDRVLCCYPELDPLLLASAARARRYWAASFPRNRWYVRLHAGWQNWRRARAGNAFRTTVHPVERIYELLSNAGMRPLLVSRRPVWEIVLCERADAR
jgi:magnesium-protoporphyrin O-methyltransferase